MKKSNIPDFYMEYKFQSFARKNRFLSSSKELNAPFAWLKNTQTHVESAKNGQKKCENVSQKNARTVVHLSISAKRFPRNAFFEPIKYLF